MPDQRLSDAACREFASEIVAAIKTDSRLEHISNRVDMTMADATRIRRTVLEILVATGAHRIGYKVGFTSDAVQMLLGIDGPEFGFLVNTMRVSGTGKLPIKVNCQTLVEPELAFEMGQDLASSGLTCSSVLEATSQVYTAFEIVESRVGLSADFRDIVADNTGSGRFVLSPVGVDPRSLAFADIAVSLRVDKNQFEARANDVLGHPANAIVWLANHLGRLGKNGGRIRKGDIILTGSSTKPVPVASGSSVSATFSGMGTMDIAFS